MGWFDKKYCDICGEKIGLFGNRKVEDGNLCKNCAKKLSPWFTERRHTDLAGIREQLKYREDNQKKLKDFHADVTLGEDMKVLVDRMAGTFMVTDAKDLEEANPDIISLDAVRDCTLDVSDYRSEETYTDRDGEEHSYSPARYTYHYTFTMKILLEHPFIDEIEFRLNRQYLDIEYRDSSFFGTGRPIPERDYGYRMYQEMAQQIIDQLKPGSRVPPKDEKGEEIRVVTCPYCGGRSRLNYDGRCEFCGGNLQE